jgi:hypothetical protein
MTLETDDTMGMSSVTEVPRWRHEARAARTEPQLLSSRLGRLELVSADASQLCFSGRRPPLAPAILTPLACALAAVPWVAPGPPSPLQLGTSAAFGLVAAGIAAWSWPRLRSVRVVSGEAAPPGARAVQPGTIRWVLDMAAPDGAAPAGYTAALRTHDGAEHIVLENTDPERLLRQLAEVLRHWPGPVECRWGLPEGARPWSIEPQSGPRAMLTTPARPVLRSALAPRPLMWCAAAMAVLVIVDLVLLVVSAGAKLPFIHPLSALLPLCFGAYLVLLAVALSTGEQRLTLAGRLRKERSIFGVTRVLGEVRPETVRGVHAIGVPDAQRWHVLVDSADGPLSVSVPRREAQALARETERALGSARTAL